LVEVLHRDLNAVYVCLMDSHPRINSSRFSWRNAVGVSIGMEVNCRSSCTPIKCDGCNMLRFVAVK